MDNFACTISTNLLFRLWLHVKTTGEIGLGLPQSYLTSSVLCVSSVPSIDTVQGLFSVHVRHSRV